MTHPALVVLGYSEAAMFVRQRMRPPVAAVISVHGRREFGVELEVPHRLDLTFDDVDVPDASDPVAVWRALSRRRWSEQNGLIEAPPSVEDAASVIRFAEQVSSGLVLCHCHGGMSRAPAVALICLSVWLGPGTEAECMNIVLGHRDGAVPHLGLVKFADDLLGRRGKLAGVVSAARRDA